jgi:hypothetical protein
MKRRTFILSAVILATAIAIPAYYFRSRQSMRNKPPLIHPIMLSQFCDEQTIRKIGMTYRSMFKAENSENQLMTFLLQDSTANNSSLPAKSIDSSQLENKIELDFKENKIVIVNGWILSLTEARQCALLSLS